MPAPVWSAAAIRLSRIDGRPEFVDMKQHLATVLAFVSTACPVTRAYRPRLQELASFVEGKTALLLINANDGETPAVIQQFVESARLAVPVYKDWRGTTADRFGATVTPEAVVVDSTGAARYTGALDDARDPAHVRVEAVKIAIHDLLAGRPVSIRPIRAVGCAISKAS